MGRHIFHVTLREKYHGATVHLFLDECLRQDESHDALDRLDKAMEARRASEEEAAAVNAVRKAKLDEAVERELKRSRRHYTDKPLHEDPDRASEAIRRLTEGTDEYDAVTPKGRTVDELVADYQVKAKKFGTIALAVNNGDEARKAYMKYKTRDSVEKMIDVLKNVTKNLGDRFLVENILCIIIMPDECRYKRKTQKIMPRKKEKPVALAYTRISPDSPNLIPLPL